VKDRGAWHAAVHGVTKSRTQLRDRTTTVEYYGGKLGYSCFLRKGGTCAMQALMGKPQVWKKEEDGVPVEFERICGYTF